MTPIVETRNGWALAGASAAANFITFGTLFSFGVFQKPIAAARHGATRGSAIQRALEVLAGDV